MRDIVNFALLDFPSLHSNEPAAASMRLIFLKLDSMLITQSHMLNQLSILIKINNELP